MYVNPVFFRFCYYEQLRWGRYDLSECLLVDIVFIFFTRRAKSSVVPFEKLANSRVLGEKFCIAQITTPLQLLSFLWAG